MSFSPKLLSLGYSRVPGYLACRGPPGTEVTLQSPASIASGKVTVRREDNRKGRNPSSEDSGAESKVGRRRLHQALSRRTQKRMVPLRARPRPFLAGSEFQGGGAERAPGCSELGRSLCAAARRGSGPAGAMLPGAAG